MSCEVPLSIILQFSPVWSQSLTYTLFTLLPILLFALVTLWKLKLNYDTDILQLQRSLARVAGGLNKSVGLNLVYQRRLREGEILALRLGTENTMLLNKTEILKVDWWCYHG
jgi:hypothetical protein